MIELVPLSPALGAEIRGVDLSQPLADADFEAILDAWHRHLVILLRGQALGEEEQVAFARRFGELSPIHTDHHSATNKAVMYIGNRKKDGKIVGALPLGEMQFHSDQCYTERPAMGTMLYSIEIPTEGGNTLFANAYKAYEALPASIKEVVNGRRAIQVYDYGGGVLDRRNMVEPEKGMSFAHPVARTHPATGRKALYVNRLMTHSIEGLPREESGRLLSLMFDTLERPEFIYEHRWRVGDLLLWDNRCTLHARRDFNPDENRWMRRVTIRGDRPR
ncbi:MAG TPA: TauD/TfdA family dioxygenase [Burkholderiales bacterium]|nr:TauD/TfdA family dioxygenase [Burkholderiales bacterium]